MLSNREQLFPKDFRILIVDDIIQNIKTLGSLLQDEGYEIEYALDGSAAIEWLREEVFDLVLLDIMMPGISGYDICKEVKLMDHHKETPIIFVSAKTEIESLVKGFELGAVDYITKPFNTKELLCRVGIQIELQWRKRELKRINAEKDRFYSIVAHDIKNPFTSLLSTFELLEMRFNKLSKDEIKEKLFKVMKDVKVIVETSNNLLHWASHQAQIKNNISENVIVSEIIEKELELLNNSIVDKNIQVDSDVPENISILFDKEQFAIVLRNIISNSIKFSQTNGKIQIKAKLTDKEVKLSIEDFGIGMPKELINNIFSVSEHTKREGTMGERGAGLGLILIKTFLENNKGSIEIKSEVNKGTLITLYLPIN